MPSDLALIRAEAASLFTFDDAGRIRGINSLDREAPPRVFFAGCRDGNIARFRHDVGADQVDAITRLFEDEPLLGDRNVQLNHLDDYRRILEEGDRQVGIGFAYELPHDLALGRDAEFVFGDSERGREMMARFNREGVPADLVDIGFANAGDLWPPWCAVLSDGRTAALAFAARLSPIGAELGLITVPAFRRQGFGAAVTAAWTRIPALADRPLFYSTSSTNIASQAVAARLGLRFIGLQISLA